MSKRLFEAAKLADLYAKYRPDYGQDIYERIDKFCRDTGNLFTLAVDVGCGSGQSTKPLTQHFEQVIGIDVSPNQIGNALVNAPNLKFEVGVAEGLSAVVPPDSVDLITIAQALHWVDTDKFYREVEKVLRPGGALVVYGYGLCVVDNPLAQDMITKFYWDTLKDIWDDHRLHVNNHYRDFSLPYSDWFSIYQVCVPACRDDSLKIRKDWTVDQFVGYLSASSGWQSYLKDHPSATDLEDIRHRFSSLYRRESGDESTVHIDFPVFMLLGQKPRV